MPRVHKQKARKDIYSFGGKVEDKSTKSGYRADKSIPRDENDTILIPAGSTYYKWTFRYGGTKRSLAYPKPSQLTQSAFLQTVYSWSENELATESLSDVKPFIEIRKEEVDQLREETQNSLDNMPDSLQYSPTGELLQERIDALDKMYSELENIEVEEKSEDEDDFYEYIYDLIEEVNMIQYQG